MSPARVILVSKGMQIKIYDLVLASASRSPRRWERNSTIPGGSKGPRRFWSEDEERELQETHGIEGRGGGLLGSSRRSHIEE